MGGKKNLKPQSVWNENDKQKDQNQVIDQKK